MAQLSQNDLEPTSFSQLLQPQAAQPQAPQMPQGGGMSELMSGQQADPSQPSMFERGQNFAQQNPLAAQMLLSTFMRMAQGGGRNLADTIGQGVSAGAQAGLMGLAQKKQDKEKAAEAQRKQEKEQQDFELRQQQADNSARQTDFMGRRVKLEEENAPVDRRYKGAQTRKTETETDINAAKAPVEVQAIQARIAALQQQIVGEKDALKSSALRRRLLGLQTLQQEFELDQDRQYGPIERGAKVQESRMRTQGQTLENLSKEQELADEAMLTPQERLARRDTRGAGKTPKSEQERKEDFFNKNQEFYLHPQTRQPDMNALEAAWNQLSMTPEKKAANEAEFQRRLNEARNAVKVGEIYLRPDGKPAKRKN